MAVECSPSHRRRGLWPMLALALAAAPAWGGPADDEGSATGAASGDPSAPTAATDGEEPRIWEDEIVVSASRAERRLDEIPLHASVIDRIELELAPDAGLIDVARQIPGLVLNGDEGNLVANPRAQSLNFRGVSGSAVSHALLLVDGFPILDPYNASAIWSKVPKALVERVEVVRGGGGNVWGSLALSGVVNVVTQAPTDRRVDASLRAGDRSTVEGAVSWADTGGAWSGWLAANYFDTDGYWTKLARERFVVDRPEWRQYESLTARASRALTSSSSLRLGASHYAEDRGEGTTIDESNEFERSLSAVVDLIGRAGSSGELRLFARTGTLEDFAGTVSDDGSTIDPRYQIDDLTSDNAGLSGQWRFGGDRHALAVGVDLQQAEVVRSEDLDWDGSAFTLRSRVEGAQRFGGAFVQDRYTPSERWTVEAGLRYDAVRTEDGRNLRTDLTTGTVTEDLLLDAHTEATWSPRLGVVHQLDERSRLRGAVYTGFRSPTPAELFVGTAPRNNRESAPNPELEPETLVGAEAGYDFTRGRDLSVRSTVFWSSTEDLIQRVTIGRVGAEGGIVGPCGFVGPRGSCVQRRNTGETRAAGIELDADYRPHPWWRLRAGAIVLDTEITDNPDDPALEGNRIERTPDRGVTVAIEFSHPRLLDALLRARYAGDRFEDPENEERVPSYYLVDLSLARRLTPTWEAFAGVENLLDREYSVGVDSGGLQKIGAPRLFHVGVRFRSR